MKGERERQGDFVFTANDVGEYRFCFNNEMSTFAEKVVDFEIAVSSPFSTWYPSMQSFDLIFSLITALLYHRWAQFDADQPDSKVENEARAQLPSKQGSTPDQQSALEESILKLSSQLSTINRNQKYFRTRENRNFSTVRSTERRIFNFSIVEGVMMVTMAGLQVFIVRFFFQGARKGYVWVVLVMLWIAWWGAMKDDESSLIKAQKNLPACGKGKGFMKFTWCYYRKGARS